MIVPVLSISTTAVVDLASGTIYSYSTGTVVPYGTRTRTGTRTSTAVLVQLYSCTYSYRFTSYGSR